MDVLLVNTPYLHLYGSLGGRRGAYFPMGLGYVAAALRAAGHAVGLIDPDAAGIGPRALGRVLSRSQADVVGIGSATPTIEGAFQIARWARARPGPRPRVVIGGPHASALPRPTLEACEAIDVVVVGEGEETAVEVVSAFEGGGTPEALARVRGIAYRDGTGVRLTAPRPAIAQVDRIPPPARDLVDLRLYRPHVYADRGRPTATILTSRGCPFRCSFCASHITMARPYRGASPARVLAEIEHIARAYGVRDFIVVDDNFAHDRARVEAICHGLVERDLGLGFFCFSRVDRASPGLLSLMRRAGFHGVYFGAESAHGRTLRTIHKGQGPDDVARGIAAARGAGLKTMAGFIIGLPGEDEAAIRATVDHAVRLSPTIGSFNVLVPYPGTEEWDRRGLSAGDVRFEGFVPKGPRAFGQGATLAPARLGWLLAWAHLRFYGRPSQISRMIKEASTWREVWTYAQGALWLALKLSVWVLWSLARCGRRPPD